MKTLLLLLLVLVMFTPTLEAKVPNTKKCSTSYVKKQSKKSLPFAKIHKRHINRKGVRK